MNSNLLLGLIFAGIIQGLALGGFILFKKKPRSQASLYLGLLILSYTLSNLQYTLEDMEIVSWNLFNLLYLPYLFLVAPLLFYFVTRFLYSDRTPNLLEKLFFIPFSLVLALNLVYKVIAITTGRTATNDSFQTYIADTIDFEGDFINIPVIMVSIIASLFVIRNYERNNIKFNSKIVKEELLWLKILLYILLLSLIPWLIYTFAYMQDETIMYLPALAIASIIIYLTGYIGIHKIHILEQRKEIRSSAIDQQYFSVVEKTKNSHILAVEKIILGEKRFLDPRLSLESLSEELQLSKSHLSRIINNDLDQSFSDYINSLRVEEAKRHLLNPEFSHYTLVAIGLESGFNSKTTFNTTFKKLTGLTPSQFKKNPVNSFQ